MSEQYYFNPIENAQKLFSCFIKYKDLPYKEFIAKINEDLNANYTFQELKIYIALMRKSHSTSQAKKMEQILKYVKSGNKDKILANELSDKKINQEFFYIKSGKSNFIQKQMNDEQIQKRKQEVLKNINNQIDMIIDNKDIDTSELLKQGKIERSLLTQVKNYLREIDTDRYIEFLMSYNKIESTSKTELSQFLETINYFIEHMENNLYILNQCDPKIDEDLIKKIKAPGEETLSSYFKDSIGRLYYNKKSNIDSLLQIYYKIANNIKIIIENENIKDFQKLSSSELIKINEDEKFVHDYYKQLQNIKKSYDHGVSLLNKINDKRKTEIDNKFTKKLLFENNN